ncbi:MAG: hypothetical protein H8D46_02825 [FCB group bacterium]|nr:hypothetical protein [FCB group bacterium]
MKFKFFATTMLGMCMVGLSMGYVLGYFAHSVYLNNFWAYLAAPILGIGGGLLIYGTLYNQTSD